MARVVLLTDINRSYVWSRTAGPIRIATELRRAGYSTQIIDFLTDFSPEQLFEVLRRYVGKETLVVGISSTFLRDPATRVGLKWYSDQDLSILHNIINTINPCCKIVLGGAIADLTSNIPFIDAHVLGYAETSFISYLKYLEGKNPFFQYEIQNNGSLLINSDTTAKDFDFAHSQNLWQPEDHVFAHEVLPIEVSRGCIFKCSFCNFPLNGKKKNDHLKDSEALYEELMRNYQLFGTTTYIFSDDTFNDSVEKMESLQKTFSRLPFNLKFVTYIRLDLLYSKPHVIQMLVDMGLQSALFGIETLNHQTGISIGKGLHPNKIKQTLDLVYSKWKGKVATAGSFIFGLPYETRQSLANTIDYLLDNNQCPLDCVMIFPLFITRYPNKIFRSVLQDQYQSFGYDFDEDGFWYNSEFHELEIRDLSAHVSNQLLSDNRQAISGFDMGMLQNFGYSFNDMYRKSRGVDIEREFSAKRAELFNQYKQKLLTASNANLS